MKIKSMSLGPLGTNCYLVYDSKDAVIFDPGGEAEKIIAFLDEQQVQPVAICLTHAHFDHIGAVDELRKHYVIDVYLHELEQSWLNEPSLNRSLAFTRKEVKTNPPECLLKPGDMKLANFQFEVIHTPGHSPGSVSFIFHEEQFMISGDVLFQQGVGRTDLPGGSTAVLMESIKNQLFTFPNNWNVYPGHGEKTTIGLEKSNNPYIQI